MTDAWASDHEDPDPGSGEEILLNISVEDERWHATVTDIADICVGTGQGAFRASQVQPADAEASLVLSNDEFVAGLNKQYRDRDGATNVLSFATYDTAKDLADIPAGMPAMLGDIVIAYDTTAREAVENGISVESHLRHLVVHGVLHLLGYDHISDEQAAVMEPLETLVLGRMGVGDPYATEKSNV